MTSYKTILDLSERATNGQLIAPWLLVVGAVVLFNGVPVVSSVSAATTADDLEAIDAFLDMHLETTPVPGFSVVIVEGNRTIFQKGYGVERVDGGRPLTTRSSIAIGSLTKSFTALATMQLVELGAVELAAPVTRYLPWFRTADGRQDEVTIRTLLHNVSGIPSRDRWLFNHDKSEDAIEGAARELSSVRLVREPGMSFEYCNENWILLGLVIAEVSGMPYSAYMQERVLNPLAMNRSTTALDYFDDIGVLYGHFSGVEEMRPAAPRFLAEALPAGSEMRATAADLGHYLAMLLGDGVFRGTRILNKESVDLLFKPSVRFKVNMPEMGLVGGEAAYAMGWIVVDVDGREVIHHGGDAIVMGSWTILDRQKKLAVSVIYNGPTLDTYRFSSKLWLANNLLHLAAGESITDFGLPDESDPTANDFDLPKEALRRYAGIYLSAEGLRAEVTLEDGADRLIFRTAAGAFEDEREIDFLSESSVALRNLSGTSLANFSLTADGEVTGLVGGIAGGIYRRRSERETAKLLRYKSPDGRTNLVLPRGWQPVWQETSFEASSDEFAGVSLRGGRGQQWSLIAEKATRAEGLANSIASTETIGGRVWRKLLWHEPGKQILLVFTDEPDGRFYLLLTTPRGSLTTPVREVLVPVLSELTFRSAIAAGH